MTKMIWAGTEDSFRAYELAIPKAAAREAEYMASANRDKVPEFPPLYRLEGNVGIVSITGSLIPGEAEWMRFYGMTGYADIKAALVEAVQDKKAQSIMLYVDSPGGAVSGCTDCSNFTKMVGTVKPMSAYAELIASAAYWIGSSAPHITIGEAAVAGSLGVIRVVTEYSKAFEKEGVTKTVMRAGKYKALGNPYEALTDDAKAEIQGKLDDMYESFMNAVVANRNVTYKVADEKMGQGREFLGKRAVEVGLVDKVGTLEEALAYAEGIKKVPAKSNVKLKGAVAATLASASVVADNAATDSQTGQTTMKPNLSAEQLAALAAGATMEVVVAMASSKPAEEAKTPEEIELARVAAEEAAAALASTQVPAEDAAVTALKAELATAQADLATANTALTAAAGQVSALEGVEASLKVIVQGAVANMSIALGKKVDTSKMTSAEMAAEHASMTATFKEKFKVGAVALPTADTNEQPKASVSFFNPRDLAAAKSIVIPTRK